MTDETLAPGESPPAPPKPDEEHDHDYGPVNVSHLPEGAEAAVLLGTYAACRICGSADPTTPKPEIIPGGPDAE